jgi:hypothetical protein
MHRPSCAATVGITHLDLMRLSKEVAALQNLKAGIGILYSTSAVIYSEEYLNLLKRTYEALNFTGIKLGFVTERMLMCGGLTPAPTAQVPDYQIIILPQATHIANAARQGLQRYVENGGRIVAIGTECLCRDEYNMPYTTTDDIPISASFSAELSSRELWEAFEAQFRNWGIPRPVSVTDDQGQPVWGVEYLAALHEKRFIVNLVNYTRWTKKVMIRAPGYHRIRNLMIDQDVGEGTLDLDPLDPVLLEIR